MRCEHRSDRDLESAPDCELARVVDLVNAEVDRDCLSGACLDLESGRLGDRLDVGRCAPALQSKNQRLK